MKPVTWNHLLQGASNNGQLLGVSNWELGVYIQGATLWGQVTGAVTGISYWAPVTGGQLHGASYLESVTGVSYRGRLGASYGGWLCGPVNRVSYWSQFDILANQ